MPSPNNSDSRCICGPYRDPVLITAQILSMIAVVFSWTTFWTMVLGFVSFVCLQVIWCCRMGICGLTTVGVLSMIAGCCSIVAGILILATGTEPICEEYAPEEDIDVNDCQVGLNAYIAISFVAGFLWIAASICVFVFSCSDRFKNAEKMEQAASNSAAVEIVGQPTARAPAAAEEAEDKP